MNATTLKMNKIQRIQFYTENIYDWKPHQKKTRKSGESVIPSTSVTSTDTYPHTHLLDLFFQHLCKYQH